MKTKILKSLLLIGIFATLLSFDLPTGWKKGGDKQGSYEMGIDKGKGHDGGNAATIKSIDKEINGFGTLMQQSKPDKYLGKRVRMTAYIKSENVKDWAGLWLRVDQLSSTRFLSFDNMQDRPIKGTTDWKKYEIVLDVPNNSSLLAYAALLKGTGQIWFDNLAFEIVDNSVKPTSSINGGQTSTVDEPTNLNFEK